MESFVTLRFLMIFPCCFVHRLVLKNPPPFELIPFFKLFPLVISVDLCRFELGPFNQNFVPFLATNLHCSSDVFN